MDSVRRANEELANFMCQNLNIPIVAEFRWDVNLSTVEGLGVDYMGLYSPNNDEQTSRIAVCSTLFPVYGMNLVRGVFLHELAHHICWNKSPEEHQADAHGKTFESWCKTIGGILEIRIDELREIEAIRGLGD